MRALFLSLSLSLSLATSCAFWSAPEGRGAVSEAARARLATLGREARAEAVERALAAADGAPDDERAQRKAAALLEDALRSADGVEPLWQRSSALRARLTEPRGDCTTLLDGAALAHAAKREEEALALEVTAFDKCRNVEGALLATRTLRALSRCADAVTQARQGYGAAETGARIAFLDEITACSDAANLEQNLSFLDETSRRGYLADLAARRCRGDCEDSYYECAASCGEWQDCRSRCAALQSACESGCHR